MNLLRRAYLRLRLYRLRKQIVRGDYKECLEARSEALRVLQEINVLRMR